MRQSRPVSKKERFWDGSSGLGSGWGSHLRTQVHYPQREPRSHRLVTRSVLARAVRRATPLASPSSPQLTPVGHARVGGPLPPRCSPGRQTRRVSLAESATPLVADPAGGAFGVGGAARFALAARPPRR